MAMPGAYTIRLTVDGHSYTQPLTVVNDPRSPANAAALLAQHDLLMKLYAGAKESWEGFNQVAAMRRTLSPLTAASQAAGVVSSAKALDAKLETVGGSAEPGARGFGRGGATPAPDFVRVNGAMNGALTALDNADMAPTAATLRSYAADCDQLQTVIDNWNHINTVDIPALNATLVQNRIPPVHAAAPKPRSPACGGTESARQRRAARAGKATNAGNTVSHSRAQEEDGDGDDSGEPR